MNNVVDRILALDWGMIWIEFLVVAALVLLIMYVRKNIHFRCIRDEQDVEALAETLKTGKPVKAKKVYSLDELVVWIKQKVASVSPEVFDMQGVIIPMEEFHRMVPSGRQFEALAQRLHMEFGWDCLLPKDKDTEMLLMIRPIGLSCFVQMYHYGSNKEFIGIWTAWQQLAYAKFQDEKVPDEQSVDWYRTRFMRYAKFTLSLTHIKAGFLSDRFNHPLAQDEVDYLHQHVPVGI